MLWKNNNYFYGRLGDSESLSYNGWIKSMSKDASSTAIMSIHHVSMRETAYSCYPKVPIPCVLACKTQQPEL